MLTNLLKRILGTKPVTSAGLSAPFVAEQLDAARAEFERSLSCSGRPRIAVVKQDINEDLYCCPPGSKGRDVVDSTLLRSGPAALFSDFDADFHIVETVDDPECSIWQERATKLNWDSLEFFRSYQNQIPGRKYGQRQFSVAVDGIDWSLYDIVISIDNSVPARITRQHPRTLWAYYVREIKVPEYKESLKRPLPGQDVVLSHVFEPDPKPAASHVLSFPYHLQRYGCLQELFGESPEVADQRKGVFVDHHTMINLSADERKLLTPFGPVASTIHEGSREVIPTSEKLARRTLDPDLRERLFHSRYFLCTPGARTVFGTAIVEAIAAGCLMLGTPSRIRCPWLLTGATSAANCFEALQLMRELDRRPELLNQQLQFQRQLIDWLCYYRPLTQLFVSWSQKTRR